MNTGIMACLFSKVLEQVISGYMRMGNLIDLALYRYGHGWASYIWMSEVLRTHHSLRTPRPTTSDRVFCIVDDGFSMGTVTCSLVKFHLIDKNAFQ